LAATVVQSNTTNGPLLRSLALRMAWAMTSLPVPVSPVMITATSLVAARLARARVIAMAGLAVTMSANRARCRVCAVEGEGGSREDKASGIA
jgi:hypothetical protein